ncbi:bifunctional diguanylate cyclase/phosphodiesterase [Rhodoferax sp. PAMC 29310]|uniref:putative bifunctional diguanylate cyclase/phosphodiesterase n=1 Tax=Rhodoferax sp. PAMC 29310 TaxID=2822760 RepID=UPI001F0A6A28|nr:bifunctional diguanylate cyclase/phosphodiesterase [Rhodoferax sp. PAMC 29310]
MNPKKPPRADSAVGVPDTPTLHQKAESIWREAQQKSQSPSKELTPRETSILLHDLQVHQIELEMQNEELRQAHEALAVSRSRYVDLYDLAPVGYCSVNEAGCVVQANLTLATLLGVTRQALSQQPPFTNFVHREDQDTWYKLRTLARESGALQTSELRLRLNQAPASTAVDDAFLWVQLSVTAAEDDIGAPMLHIAVSDIRARKQAEAKLLLSASVFGNTHEGIMIINADANIMDVNDAFTRITGYSRSEAIGQDSHMLRSDRQDAAFYESIWRDLTEKGHWSGEMWSRHKSGELFAQLSTVNAVRDEQGMTQHYVAVFSDISAAKAHQAQLEHMAQFDALTQLPNRVLLADRLELAMVQAQRRGQQVAVVYLDLDGFKSINDRHGHGVGDQYLITVAAAMHGTLREGDTLARIGGDEFVALFIDLASAESCVSMLARLLEAAAAPVQLGALLLQGSASMGVTFYPQSRGIEADQLMRQADQAMYQAKMEGKNRYHLFDAEQDTSIRGHHETLDRIRLALAQSEFVLHYQPKVNMRSGQVIGAEALIRWQHPEKGLLAPAAFLPVIEDHPLAVDVGEWVIDATLTQIGLWQAVGLELAVSVNLGARQLQQSNFVARLQFLLGKHPKVSSAHLMLEVLETSAMADIGQVSQVIEDCAKMGVMFALDDFGTGYSSLTYLRRLRVAQLKIDQSFVRDMLDDPDDRAILQGVISLAAAFKREVIAEGVETVAHGTVLLQLGCELAQGYGIARPMPPEQMPTWVATWQPDAAWCATPKAGTASRAVG